jgi:hypothetical protein
MIPTCMHQAHATSESVTRVKPEFHGLLRARIKEVFEPSFVLQLIPLNANTELGEDHM